MTTPRLVGTDFGGPADAALLLLGPSLGTSAATLWDRPPNALPSAPASSPGTCPGTAAARPPVRSRMPSWPPRVLALADDIAPGQTFHYAGDSVGGASDCSCCSTRPNA